MHLVNNDIEMPLSQTVGLVASRIQRLVQHQTLAWQTDLFGPISADVRQTRANMPARPREYTSADDEAVGDRTSRVGLANVVLRLQYAFLSPMGAQFD